MPGSLKKRVSFLIGLAGNTLGDNMNWLSLDDMPICAPIIMNRGMDSLVKQIRVFRVGGQILLNQKGQNGEWKNYICPLFYLVLQLLY